MANAIPPPAYVLASRKIKEPMTRLKSEALRERGFEPSCPRSDECRAVGPESGAEEIVPGIEGLEISPPVSAFCFLGLPSEIRLRVYRHVLVSSNPIKIIRREHRPAKWSFVEEAAILAIPEAARPATFYLDPSNKGHITVAVLLVSRLVHAESAPILYGCNTWHLVLSAWHATFLASIGVANTGYIRKVRLRGYSLSLGPDWTSAIGSVVMMGRLRRFEVPHLSAHGCSRDRYDQDEKKKRKPKRREKDHAGVDREMIALISFLEVLVQVHPSLKAAVAYSSDGRNEECGMRLVSEEERMTGKVGLPLFLCVGFEMPRGGDCSNPECRFFVPQLTRTRSCKKQDRYISFTAETNKMLDEGRNLSLSQF